MVYMKSVLNWSFARGWCQKSTNKRDKTGVLRVFRVYISPVWGVTGFFASTFWFEGVCDESEQRQQQNSLYA
jgi:hypothetical protein